MNRIQRVWGLAMLIGAFGAPVVLGVGIAIAASGVPDYSHFRDFMSELGASTNERDGIASATFAATGLLIGLSAIGLWKARSELRPVAVAILLYAADGLGSAVAPCSPGCPQPGEAGFATTDAIHLAIGLVGLAGLVAAPMLMARVLRTQHLDERLRRASVIAGVALAVAVLGWMVAGAADWGAGLVQRSTSALFYAWLIVAVVSVWASQHARDGAEMAEPLCAVPG